MARPLRIQAPGLSYHITARGNGRMAIYTDDRDRERFLELLAQVAELHNVTCHAYCLMTNHYHLVATTASPNVSRAVRQLNGPYAQWWNRRHGHVGHVFQGRFGAQVVQDDTYLVTVCRYVVLNPVRARLVDRPRDWPWSSYRATAGLAAVPPFLRPALLWRQIGGDDLERGIHRYREFVADGETSRTKLPKDSVLGNAAFVNRFKDWRQRASPEVAARERKDRPPLDELFVGAATKARRNVAVARAFGLGHPVVAIARHLDLHHSTVSKVLAAEGRGRARS